MIKETSKQYNINYTSLENYGIDSVAFTIDDALRMVDAMKKELMPILGGDIYVLDGTELQPAYLNWHCERTDGQNMASFVHNSCACARGYLTDIKRHFVTNCSKQLLVEFVSFI